MGFKRGVWERPSSSTCTAGQVAVFVPRWGWNWIYDRVWSVKCHGTAPLVLAKEDSCSHRLLSNQSVVVQSVIVLPPRRRRWYCCIPSLAEGGGEWSSRPWCSLGALLWNRFLMRWQAGECVSHFSCTRIQIQIVSLMGFGFSFLFLDLLHFLGNQTRGEKEVRNFRLCFLAASVGGCCWRSLII